MKKIKYENMINLIYVLVFITVLVSFTIYIMNPIINSDSVEGVFWAKAILESKRILSTSMIYGYAIPFGGNLFMLPFVMVYGVSLIANNLGMLLFFIVMVITIYFFSYSLVEDYFKACIVTAIILLGFRGQTGTNLLAHILHYQLSYICLIGLFASVFIIMKNDKEKGFVGLAVWALWAGANGMVTFIMSVVPVIVALIVHFSLEKNDKKKIVRIIGVMLIASLSGILVNKLSLIGVHENGYDDEFYAFLSSEEWVTHASKLLLDWVSLFIKNSTMGIRIASKEGIEILLECAFILLAALIPIIYICRFKSINLKMKMLLTADIIVWLVCLAQYIFFRGALDRLLYNGLLMNFVLIGVYYGSLNIQTRLYKVLKVFMMLAIIFYAAMFPVDKAAEVYWDKPVLEQIEARGLTYGFATFWNANVNTVLSDDALKIREVFISEGHFVSGTTQVEPSWYEPKECEEFFIMLTREEESTLSDKTKSVLTEDTKEMLEFEKYLVYIFDSQYWEELIQFSEVK